jgi:hypothetical protein
MLSIEEDASSVAAAPTNATWCRALMMFPRS